MNHWVRAFAGGWIRKWSRRALGALFFWFASPLAFKTQAACILMALWSLIMVESAFSQVPGTKRWELVTRGHVSSSPAVAEDGTIFFGAGNDTDPSNRGWLYSVKPNGTTNWILSLPQYVLSSPAIGADGRVFVGCWNGEVLFVQPTGEFQSVKTPGHVVSSPAVGLDGTIYVGSATNDFNQLYALRPDGSVRWVFQMGRVPNPEFPRQFSSPTIGPDGTIYVGSLDKNLYAIRPDGTTNWVFLLANPTNASPATAAPTYASPAIGADGTIYVGADNGFFYAIHPQGYLKWAFAAKAQIESSAAVANDGTVYFGALDGSFYALNPNGTLKWSYATGGVSSSPAIGKDGTVYIVSYQSSKLFAFNSAGMNLWTFVADDSFSSPALAPDGTIYLGTTARVSAVYGTNAPQGSAWPMFRGNPRHTARSVQRIIREPVLLADGNLAFDLTVETGRLYQLDYSINLVDWHTLTNFFPPAFSCQLLDLEATNSPLRFYRLTTSLP